MMHCFLNFFPPIQLSMDLPPDKAKLLKNYDNEKKWDIICDQVSSAEFFEVIALNLLTFSGNGSSQGSTIALSHKASNLP